ncbi:MAG: glutamate synthase subunit beta [Candidatus Omnitrophota bacterium]|nr:glutamate synthase subunit beta [Candidatus Omnitrophota bacterium]
MGDIKGFLKSRRQEAKCRPVCLRLKDYRDVISPRSDEATKEQASRCMDCGTPFCHWACPIGNYIPEYNDAVFSGQWKKAFGLLQANNNFPEFTGRLCPALCEYACVLGINDDPITIKENELAIIEYAFDAGFIRANAPKKRTNKKIAVIGSGPAGLAAADQLNKAGHKVVVFERDDKIGGILRYGIPDFKLEKWIIDRRLAILEKEGMEFITGINIGIDYKVSKLKKEFDAICLAIGSRTPRDLKIEGRELKDIYFAMDYLTQVNRRVAKENIVSSELIDAKGKRIVVIGGGDTGADCVGTANRQGASCVVQIEVMLKPDECRTDDYPWPKYPLLLKTTSSHEEGAQRDWCILTKKFIGEDNILKKLSCVRVEFVAPDVPRPTSNVSRNNCPVMKEISGSDFTIDADMAILAVGFIHPEHSRLLTDLGVKFDERGNVKTDINYMTSAKNVFSVGDARRGQSLIVWAISEGRSAAHSIDKYLMGESNLPVI